MTRYVIGDHHFGHENIIDYCQRPFDSVEDMNAEMRHRWNAQVSPRDTVIHLGDVRHHPDPYSILDWFSKLNGEILLVKGNHDNIGQNQVFNTVKSATIQHGRYEFYLEHQPVGFSGWQIHGHAHNNDIMTYPFIHPGTQRVNVSVELLNYRPLELDNLVRLLDKGHQYDRIDDTGIR